MSSCKAMILVSIIGGVAAVAAIVGVICVFVLPSGKHSGKCHLCPAWL